MDAWNLKGGRLKFLSPSEIEEIHQRSLDVLQQVGCFFEHEEALDIFEKNGAVVSRTSNIVKIPRHLVEAALSHCPSSMLLAARDPARDIHAEGGPDLFRTGNLPGIRDRPRYRFVPQGGVSGLPGLCPADRRSRVHSFFQDHDHPQRHQSKGGRTVHGRGGIQ